jgi:hypothetical protein
MVQISWDKPDKRGSEITEYEILMRDQSGDFNLVTELCSGTDEVMI